MSALAWIVIAIAIMIVLFLLSIPFLIWAGLFGIFVWGDKEHSGPRRPTPLRRRPPAGGPGPRGPGGGRGPGGRTTPGRGPYPGQYPPPYPPQAPAPPFPTAPGRLPKGSPLPGEVWWAEVPFAETAGSKDRPCLVLAVENGGGTYWVAKITTKYKDRPGVIQLPPGSVGDRQGRVSYLEVTEARAVRRSAFRRRVGPVPPGIWQSVMTLSW